VGSSSGPLRPVLAVTRLLAGLRCSIALLIAGPPPVGAAVLHDQTDFAAPIGYSSNEFSEGSYIKIADDFTVPPGATWQIRRVDVLGSFDPENRPPSRVNLEIYADAGGLPGSVLLTGDYFATNGPNYSIALGQTGPSLGPGRYWLAVQQAEARRPDMLWSWRGRTQQTGYPAAVLTPSDCPFSPNWGERRSCPGGGDEAPDQIFRLSDTLAGPPLGPPPTLSRQSALSAARARLQFLKSWRRGHSKRISCVRQSPTRFRCAVSWRYAGDRFAGYVLVRLVDERLRTTIQVSRR
jgi:hypothetical protein